MKTPARLFAVVLTLAIGAPLAVSVAENNFNFANQQVHPLYEGLLPSGVTPKAAPLPADFKTAKLAVVSSANFNRYVMIWNKASGRTKAFSLLGGIGLGEALGPDNVTAKLLPLVTPHFSSAFAASDLADARDKGADYILVVDYWCSAINGGQRLKTRAGVYLLNAQLDEVLALHNESEAPMKISLFAPWNVLKDQEVSFANGMAAVVDPLAAKIKAALAGG